MAKKSDLREHLRKLKLDYLDSCGAPAGTAEGFRAVVEQDRGDKPEVYAKGASMALGSLRAEVWEGKVEAPEKDQLFLPGLEARGPIAELTIYDPEKIGKFRRVLITHANIDHLRDDATIKFSKAAETTTVAQKTMALHFKLLEAVKGSTDANVIRAARAAGLLPPVPDPEPPAAPGPTPPA